MPSGQTPSAENRQPVTVNDSAIFDRVYVGTTSAPLEVLSGSVGTSSLTSAVASLSTVASGNLSTGTSIATSAGVSLSTVGSTSTSSGVSRDTSQSTILSVTTSTANSG